MEVEWCGCTVVILWHCRIAISFDPTSSPRDLSHVHWRRQRKAAERPLGRRALVKARKPQSPPQNCYPINDLRSNNPDETRLSPLTPCMRYPRSTRDESSWCIQWCWPCRTEPRGAGGERNEVHRQAFDVTWLSRSRIVSNCFRLCASRLMGRLIARTTNSLIKASRNTLTGASMYLLMTSIISMSLLPRNYFQNTASMTHCVSTRREFYDDNHCRIL